MKNFTNNLKIDKFGRFYSKTGSFGKIAKISGFRGISLKIGNPDTVKSNKLDSYV